MRLGFNSVRKAIFHLPKFVTAFDEVRNLWSPLVILIGRFHSVNHTSHEVKLDYVQVLNSNVRCIYVYKRYSPTYVISGYAISDLRDS